jgi:hypothetical protein
LITDAVAADRGLAAFRDEAASARARLLDARGVLSDSSSGIRDDRDR